MDTDIAMRPCRVKPPASRVRNFGDQSVGVASIENAGHFRPSAARIGDSLQMRGVFEFLPDVGIRESAGHMLTIEQSAKEPSAD